MAVNLTEDARKKANLRVLQRSDSVLQDILGHATHVVLYEFTDNKWEKLPVEGSLFLVKRTGIPRFRLMVLNRTSPENFQVDLTPHFQLQHKDPYLIFRSEQKIKGIWFHNPKERQEMATLLPRVVQSLEVDPETAATALLNTVSLGVDGGVPTPPPRAATSPAAQIPPKTSSTPPIYQQQHQPAVPAAATATASSLVLDKKSLQLALLSLMNDERFLDLLHAQYLKVAHARAQRKPNNGNNNSN